MPVILKCAPLAVEVIFEDVKPSDWRTGADKV